MPFVGARTLVTRPKGGGPDGDPPDAYTGQYNRLALVAAERILARYE